MKKLFILTLLALFLVRLGFSMDKKEKRKLRAEQYYDINFTVYKYLAEDQLKDKELPDNKKRELLKKRITVCEEDKSYIKDFMISKNIRVNFKFDFKEFLILKIYINDKESIVFQNKAMDFELNFKAAQKENYLIETTFQSSYVPNFPPGIMIGPGKTTKKKIKKSSQ